MIRIKNLLRLTALLSVSAIFLLGCETIKGAGHGAYRGAKKDVQQVVAAAKGETEDPQGLGVAVDAVMKTDKWIKDNMW